MPDGYDFTLDEDKEIAAQRRAAREAEEWLFLDEKAMSGELNGLNSRVSACALQLSRMMADNDYTKTKEMLLTLMTNDLGADGWMCAFYNTNKEAFSKAVGTDHPAWVNGLLPEEIKAYDAALKYYRDIEYLMKVRTSVDQLLRYLQLAEGFRLLRVKDNFEAAGFDVGFYNRINSDVQKISDFLNRDWDELEKNAHSSKSFLEANSSKLPKRELEKNYGAESILDFQSMVRSYGLLDSFVELPDGNYRAKPDLLAKTAVIDRYTYQVTQTADLKDRMQKILDDCKRAKAESIAEASQKCKIQAAQFLCGAFEGLVDAVSTFAEMCLNAYVNFKEGKAEAPYCFMKKLSSMSIVKPKYQFSPDTSEPWVSGTSYEIMYEQAANALGAQARVFAYDHGTTIF